MQMLLNINKCILCTPFDVFYGDIVCKEGLLVDPSKSVAIVNLLAPGTISSLLGHIRYYR
jgi:hypothetical protein